MDTSIDSRTEIVDVRHISKTFVFDGVEVNALDDVTFRVPRRQMLAIMGPSGTGKSTLLHILGGLELPTSGEIFIDGSPLSGLSDVELTLMRRRKIGFVFQSFNLLPSLSVVDNVTLPLILDGISRHEAFEKAREALRQVDLLHRLQHPPTRLSGGEQQRVAIARALVIGPSLILADEPTGNLDSVRGGDITGLFHSLAREKDLTVVIVTHDIRVAAIADRLIVLRDGRIAYDGHPVADTDWLAALQSGVLT